MSFSPINPYGRPATSLDKQTPQAAQPAPEAATFARRPDPSAKMPGAAGLPAVAAASTAGSSERIAKLIDHGHFKQALSELGPWHAKTRLPNGDMLLHQLARTPWGDQAPVAMAVAQKLLDWDAPINAATPNGMTPLRVAGESCNTPAVLFLAGRNAALMPAAA